MRAPRGRTSGQTATCRRRSVGETRRNGARAVGVPLTLALTVALAGGCGSTSGPSASGSGGPGSTAGSGDQVQIKDYDFVPTTVTVRAGTTVSWTDDDTSDHWVVSAPASPEAFDLGRQGTGRTVTHTFAQPGTYPYYCNLHNYMKGTVVVT